jgi:pilus assembly protein CpaF
MTDGSRKVVSISEITGMEGEVVCMQEIFLFERRGLTESGKVRGVFRPTGIRPKFAERLIAAGFRLPTQLFEQAASYAVG